MLHRYAFTNFQSFRERTEVNLRLNGNVPPIPWEAIAASGERVSLLCAIVGPNASGKTALLKPLVFAEWFARASFHVPVDATIAIDPHFASPNEPTEIEVEFNDSDGQLWRYELRLTRERVLREALYRRRSAFSYVFVREWNAQEKTYNVKQQDFGLKPSEAKKVRPNASLISTAAQYGVPLAQQLVQTGLQSNVVAMGRLNFNAVNDLPEAAEHFALNTDQQATMIELLRGWDLGLSDIELRELRELSHPNKDGETVKFWFPFGVHQDGAGVRKELSFLQESSGTQSAFVLLSRLLPVLANGGIAVIDEFENDLHPFMLEPILDLFASEHTNPKKAQLLFTCHAMEVLNLLHKSQVMLVEKKANCESNGWRMDTVRGIRSDDNFYAKYMAGAYGAVPQL
jgi:uncharacterized protein